MATRKAKKVPSKKVTVRTRSEVVEEAIDEGADSVVFQDADEFKLGVVDADAPEPEVELEAQTEDEAPIDPNAERLSLLGRALEYHGLKADQLSTTHPSHSAPGYRFIPDGVRLYIGNGGTLIYRERKKANNGDA